MGYELEITADARRSFERLNRSTAQRIYTKLKEISDDPHPFVKRLKGADLFSLRVSDYRVILDIQRRKMIMLVVKVGHRREVYTSL